MVERGIRAALLVAVVLCAVFVAGGAAADWSVVDQILQAGVQDGAYPGCVALVGNKNGIIYERAVGHYTYGATPPFNSRNPPMAIDTLFDMASCTKVTTTTTAVAQFYQRGELPLHTRIADVLGKEYAQHGKGDITVLNCLLHNTGYPPDPSPNYWDPAFGCPETSRPHPEENFSCQDRIYKSLLAQTLANPVGSVYVYSDLSMITLMYVVGNLAKDLGYVKPTDIIAGCDQGGPGAAQCYFEAYVRRYVFHQASMYDSFFLPPRYEWSRSAPCENDTTYLHKVIQGQVSDGNAYALGGIAGHAGLFSNAPDLWKLMTKWMWAPANDSWLNRTTAELWVKEYNHSQSSRALGWNTNDPNAPDQGWGLSCGRLSAKTFMHIGYTGTEMCGDPVNGVVTILLTNRVYPSADNNKVGTYRRKFNDAVVEVLGLHGSSAPVLFGQEE